MGMHFGMALARIAFLIFATLGIAVPAYADDWAVSRIQYANEGAYVSRFTVRGEKFDGFEVKCKERSSKATAVEAGQTVTIKVSEGEDIVSDKCRVLPGYEVWGIVDINIGLGNATWDQRNCRKNNARFFAHPDGGTLTVYSKGTTKDNNRCRLRSRGGVRWDASVHGPNIYQD